MARFLSCHSIQASEPAAIRIFSKKKTFDLFVIKSSCQALSQTEDGAPDIMMDRIALLFDMLLVAELSKMTQGVE